MKSIINLHKRNMLKVKNLSTRDCNCRNKTKYPFNRCCLAKDICKATIYCAKGGGGKAFVRSTGVSFKLRFNQHTYSLNSDKRVQTTLSKFNKANRNGISQKNCLLKVFCFFKHFNLFKYLYSVI